MFNHASIVHILLEHGANPLLNNWEGMTAVDLAKEASNSRHSRDINERLSTEIKVNMLDNISYIRVRDEVMRILI